MLFRSDRKSTRLNSSHLVISYAVFCLKKKNIEIATTDGHDTRVGQSARTPSSLRAPSGQRKARRDSPLLNRCGPSLLVFFFFNDTATTEIYTLSLHDALPI